VSGQQITGVLTTMNVVSFVDRDMVMRYFGGGIGHLKNAPPLQVPGFDPIDPSSEEMAVEDDDDPFSGTNEDLGAVVQQPSRDVVMNGGELVQLEVGENDEDDEDDEEDDEDSDDDEGGDQTDEDEDREGEDDYGYASA
jgi:hypothetical protein